MAALSLTRAQIIAQGLALAGRPDLTSDARLWLNLFLEKMYMTQDFDWLVKTGSGLSVTNGVAFPTDYRAGKSGIINYANGSTAPVTVLARADEYDMHKISIGPTTEGQPEFVYANHDERKFYFLPAPDQVYTWDLKYFYIPTLPDHTDSGTDTQTVKWGLPATILIDHIKARAFEYNDDQRQEGANVQVMNDVTLAKMNNHDKRAGSTRMPMGKRFRGRFR